MKRTDILIIAGVVILLLSIFAYNKYEQDMRDVRNERDRAFDNVEVALRGLNELSSYGNEDFWNNHRIRSADFQIEREGPPRLAKLYDSDCDAEFDNLDYPAKRSESGEAYPFRTCSISYVTATPLDEITVEISGMCDCLYTIKD